MTADPLDRLLAASASSADLAAPSAELDGAFEAMAVQIKCSPPRRPLRHRAVIIAAAASSMALAGPAAAGWVSARTGWFGAPGMTETDTSEFLRGDSPEMAAIVEHHGRDYPLPPDGTYARVVERLRDNNEGRGPGLIQETGVRAMVAQESVCQWERLWLAADDAGDIAGRRQAGTVLDDASSWPVFSQGDGGGVVELRRNIGTAAAEGARAPVELDFRLNCAGGDLRPGR